MSPPNKRRTKEEDGNEPPAKKKAPEGGGLSDDDDSAAGSNVGSIPIFLKKTYNMIESCDDGICAWSEDGTMFVVKDPDAFATNVIPQYFDHNKFSSFARQVSGRSLRFANRHPSRHWFLRKLTLNLMLLQLNFYGFRKSEFMPTLCTCLSCTSSLLTFLVDLSVQTKPIRNADIDPNTGKHVTFYNGEKFVVVVRCDVLFERDVYTNQPLSLSICRKVSQRAIRLAQDNPTFYSQRGSSSIVTGSTEGDGFSSQSGIIVGETCARFGG